MNTQSGLRVEKTCWTVVHGAINTCLVGLSSAAFGLIYPVWRKSKEVSSNCNNICQDVLTKSFDASAVLVSTIGISSLLGLVRWRRSRLKQFNSEAVVYIQTGCFDNNRIKEKFLRKVDSIQWQAMDLMIKLTIGGAAVTLLYYNVSRKDELGGNTDEMSKELYELCLKIIKISFGVLGLSFLKLGFDKCSDCCLRVVKIKDTPFKTVLAKINLEEKLANLTVDSSDEVPVRIDGIAGTPTPMTAVGPRQVEGAGRARIQSFKGYGALDKKKKDSNNLERLDTGS